MHIFLITHYFEPEAGAPQRRWSALIDRFAAAGHSVTVFAPAPHYPQGRVHAEHRKSLRQGTVQRRGDGVTVHRVAHLPHRGDIATRSIDHAFTAAAALVKASRVARSMPPSVVIATAPAIESLIAGQLIARRFGAPFVAEMRDAWPDLVAFTAGTQASTSPLAMVKRLVHRFVTALQASAAVVVTTTQSFAEVLRQRGIAHVEVLRNGTTHTALPPIAEVSVEDPSRLRVLYMGTVGRSQGLEVLIESVNRLAADNIPVDVRIIGHGADLAHLHRLNRAAGSVVDIRDAVAPSEVRAHYEWADTTVVSLRDWEPFSWTVPSKLYELLATGRHITALVAGEAAGIVRTTGAGMVVSPGNAEELAAAWRSLLQDRSLLDVGLRGRDWARQFADFDALAAEYLGILQRVVDQHAINRR